MKTFNVRKIYTSMSINVVAMNSRDAKYLAAKQTFGLCEIDNLEVTEINYNETK